MIRQCTTLLCMLGMLPALYAQQADSNNTKEALRNYEYLQFHYNTDSRNDGQDRDIIWYRYSDTGQSADADRAAAQQLINIPRERFYMRYQEEAIFVDDVEANATIKSVIGDKLTEPQDEEGGSIFSAYYLRGASQFDSRIEPRELNPIIPWHNLIRDQTVSVGMLMEREKLHPISDSLYQLDISITLGERFRLCTGQTFAEQPVIGTGTAFIIGARELLTAGHVFSGPLQNYVLVFGFEMKNKAGDFSGIVHASDIYYPTTILQRDEGLDVLLFRVDRALQRPVLSLAGQAAPVNTPLYMIGHPSGLPQKVATNARVIESRYPYSFTSLDAFQGNSGSPVFRSDTHEVMGILVSGQVDYSWTGTCYTSTLCRTPYCEGEKAVSSAAVKAALELQ